MHKSQIMNLTDYFLGNVSYLSFILSRETPFMRKTIRLTYIIYFAATFLGALYSGIVHKDPFFILPIMVLFAITNCINKLLRQKDGH